MSINQSVNQSNIRLIKRMLQSIIDQCIGCHRTWNVVSIVT